MQPATNLPEARGSSTNSSAAKATILYVFSSDNGHDDVLLQDYSHLMNDCRYSDIKLIVEDHHFQCHKSILTARCAVFANLIDMIY